MVSIHWGNAATYRQARGNSHLIIVAVKQAIKGVKFFTLKTRRCFGYTNRNDGH